jgi:thioredoxin 1
MPTTIPDLPSLDRFTFDETIGASERPVLVDVWGPGCTACSTLAATLETMAAGDASRAYFQVDGSTEVDIAIRYDVRAVPTLLVFNQGELVGRLVGARGPRRLASELEELLSTTR